MRAPLVTIFGVAVCAFCIQAASFSLNHAASIKYDFANQPVPHWSGGALVGFTSDHTAAPVLLTFDEQGQEIHPVVLTIPDGTAIDLWDVARGRDGTLAACGMVHDRSDTRSGFIAIFNPAGDRTAAVRLNPYYPSRVTVGSDGTIWTAGLEVVNGVEKGLGVNPQDGVIRHFDSSGKQIGSYIPRSSIASAIMADGGRLQSADGRIGWYTGPASGPTESRSNPGTEYYEILSDGTVHKHSGIDLGKWEWVTGLALMDDGSAYATTYSGSTLKTYLFSIGASGEQWKRERVPVQNGYLYGGDSQRLVFSNGNRFSMAFVDVSQ